MRSNGKFEESGEGSVPGSLMREKQISGDFFRVFCFPMRFLLDRLIGVSGRR